MSLSKAYLLTMLQAQTDVQSDNGDNDSSSN